MFKTMQRLSIFACASIILLSADRLSAGGDTDLKVSVEGQEAFTLSPVQQEVFRKVKGIEADDKNKALIAEIKKQIDETVDRAYQESLHQFKKTWLPKLKERKIAVSTDDDKKFMKKVFSQPDFKSNYGNDCGAVKGVVKITVNDKPLLKISAAKKRVLCNAANQKFTDKVIPDRIGSDLDRWFSNEISNRFRSTWQEDFSKRGEAMPADDEAFAERVFEQIG